jgi:O-antigen ligase
MKKYLAEAPWGIGIGNDYNSVPPNNRFRRLSTIPPDSEYVYIWVHTGIIGLSTFLFINAIILFGACHIIFFRLKNRSLQGIASGMTCAFISIHLGGYVNQVLMQFPNCLVFYGAMTIVYMLPSMEPAWNEYEEKMLEKQNLKKKIKEEKRRASRV